ncbi:zinc ribbon domain-containing protein [Streptococcus jiangjianxini]|uniref:zinc ribbon domain-containing protein n=1 Tax=Streptococcus jiangjianxini TaxID=3161189 RepID=UPI0032EFBDAD
MISQEQWITLFEQVTGRKPTPKEFKAGKESGFATDIIYSITGLDKKRSASSPLEVSSLKEKREGRHDDWQENQVLYDVSDEAFSEESDLNDSPKKVLQDQESPSILYDVSDEAFSQESDLNDSSIKPLQDQESPRNIYEASDEIYAEETSFTSNESSQLLMPKLSPSNTANKTSQHPTGRSQVEMKSAQEQHIGPAKSLKEKQVEWIAAFEKFVGRKPSPKEFKAGKENHFDLRIIHQFLGQTSKKARKPLRDKKRYLYIAGGVLATAILGVYLFGNHYYSRESVAKRYLETSDTIDQQLEYEVWSDSQKPIKESEVSYLTKSTISKPELVDLLSGNTMAEVGRKWLVFPEWKVMVQPADTTISTNTKGMTISINDKRWEKSDSDHFSKTIRLYPGDYHFSLTGKLDDQEVSTSSKQTLKRDEHVALDIAYLSFTVNSNLADGDLYVGSKKITRLSNGKAEVSNLAVTKNAKLSVQKTFEDASKVTSNTYLIKNIEDGDSVTLDVKGVLDRDTADQLLTAAYRKLGDYEDNHTTPDGLTEIFQGGATNSMYKDVVNMIETNTTNAKNRPAESISFDDIDVTNVKQVSAKKYVVDFTVVNSFYYAYDSKFKNSGYYDDKTAWSVTVDYVGKKDQSDESNSYFSDYRITGKASDSKLINRKDTVN